MFLGLAGSISVVDDPTQATQGTCPSGYAESYGVCIQVTNTAPGTLVETDPSKLPPSSRIDGKKLAVVGVFGLIAGVTIHLLKKR